MAKPAGAQVVAQALQYAQEKRSYQEMDCQAMIEAAVRACGGRWTTREATPWRGP